jgi:hypothetical protein
MGDTFHCPKCQTDLRHSLGLHGAELARCPYCAYAFSRPESDPPTQASTTPAKVTDARSDQNITNAPRAGRPVDPITREPLRWQRHYAEDDDYLPARKRILSNKDRWRSSVQGVVAGMASGLALGIICGGICTAGMSPQVDIAILVSGTGLMFVGAIIGGLVGYAIGAQAEPRHKDDTPRV